MMLSLHVHAAGNMVGNFHKDNFRRLFGASEKLQSRQKQSVIILKAKHKRSSRKSSLLVHAFITNLRT
jgi:hypothetical protein